MAKKVSKLNEQLGKFTAAISTIVSRADLANRAGITYDGKRDLYSALGYRRVLTYAEYYDRYLRGGIAARVVDAFPNATWRNPPEVFVKDQEEFGEIWRELAQRLSLFHYIERADRLAGVGRFSALFLGTTGARDLKTPITNVKGPEGVLFVSIFSEPNASITTLDDNPTSERFGLPAIYDVKFLNNKTINSRITARRVHSSRIIHIADGLLEDDIFGTPRLQRIWNYLDDLDKVIGGSSEAVWRTVDRGIQFDLDKDLTLLPADEEAFSDEIEEYMHGIKRYIKTQGITAKVLGSDTPDPTGPVESILGLISGTTGIPQRILLGSERGELASGQDERNFNSRVRERQLSYAEPIILRPLLNRLISIKALPEPKGEVIIDWPDLAVQTKREEADIAARLGQAVRNVSEQGRTGMFVIPPKLFATRYLNIDSDEYDEALEEFEATLLDPLSEEEPRPVGEKDDNEE